MAKDNVVTLDSARWKKEIERKEEKVDAMRERFEQAFPDKPTPVKDYLKNKKNKKKKR